MKRSLAILILSIMVSGPALGLDDVIVPEVIEPHESPTDDPWIPRPEEMLSTAALRCEPVVRGIYESIQVNVDHRGCNIPGDAANEPSIAIDPNDPRKIVIGWRQFDSVESSFRQAGYAYSHDAGNAWNFRGVLDPGVFGSDPVVAADTDGTFYYLTINIEEARLFRSHDSGVSWESPLQVYPGFFDKPWMAIDRTGTSSHGNLYIQRMSSLLRMQPSKDELELYDFATMPNFPTNSVGPDGILHMVGEGGLYTQSSSIRHADEGLVLSDFIRLPLGGSMQLAGPPNPLGLLGQLWVATDHSGGPHHGNVYVLGSVDPPGPLADAPFNVAFTRSTDGGLTWSDAIYVNDDDVDNGAWHWFSIMSVAPNGRIDAVWNDSRDHLESPDGNLCELYYSYSIDAGVSWSTNIPVSPVFDSHVGWPGAPKLGDYYHMLSDNLGVNVAYAATFNGEQDIYFLRIGPWDCNGNEIPDEDDLSCGGGNVCNDMPGSFDCNGNQIPDECEYRMDFDGDRVTTLSDFAAFQRCYTGPQEQIGLCCSLLDQNNDASIDLTDYAQFNAILTGP